MQTEGIIIYKYFRQLNYTNFKYRKLYDIKYIKLYLQLHSRAINLGVNNKGIERFVGIILKSRPGRGILPDLIRVGTPSLRLSQQPTSTGFARPISDLLFQQHHQARPFTFQIEPRLIQFQFILPIQLKMIVPSVGKVSL